MGDLPDSLIAAVGVAARHTLDPSTLQLHQRRTRALIDLSRLSEVDESITLARSETVALEEHRALRALARAEQQLSSSLYLPGAAAFYAELQLQLGVSAAHSGLDELAFAAFTRAASVAPKRRLLAGEAAPQVVALATRAFERVAAAAEGTLSVDVDAPAARVFVDDVAVGIAPLSVRVRGGLHVLRVEARGYTSYARLFEMLEGERPPLRIRLAPEPSAAAVRALERARTQHAADSIAEASRDVLNIAPDLAMVLVGERAAGRGWFARCERSGCSLHTYVIAAEDRPSLHAQGPLSRQSLRRVRQWLTPVIDAERATAPVSQPSALWQRWYVWAAAFALALGAGVGVGAATQPEPERTLRVRVDPSALH